MGVTRLLKTLRTHEATSPAFLTNVPDVDSIYFDFNAMIHVSLHTIIDDLNEIAFYLYCVYHKIVPYYFENSPYSFSKISSLVKKYGETYGLPFTYPEYVSVLQDKEKIENIIYQDILLATKYIISFLNKNNFAKKLFISIDGVPSMAKMAEQKNRRYMGAIINELLIKSKIKYRFRERDVYQLDEYEYRLKISCGSPLMVRIQDGLANTNFGIPSEVSTFYIKGEGEKKIICDIMESEYQNICIISPDSDIFIITGFIVNDPRFENKNIYNFWIERDSNLVQQLRMIDLNIMISSLTKFYGEKIKLTISPEMTTAMLYSLFVFGNDFLPNILPFKLPRDLDIVCKISLETSLLQPFKISIDNESRINYQYLIHFFEKLDSISKEIYTDDYYQDIYHNYYAVKKRLILKEKHISKLPRIHRDTKPIEINSTNIHYYRQQIKKSFMDLKRRVLSEDINHNNVVSFCKFFCNLSKENTYFVAIMPKIVDYPGMLPTNKSVDFFCDYVLHMKKIKNTDDTKLLITLFERNACYNEKESQYDYLKDQSDINYGLEEYEGLFNIQPISLFLPVMTERGTDFIDCRDKYYITFVNPIITGKEIENMAEDYVIGIEWLYQYYVENKHAEWSSWKYHHTKPPLIRDIIEYLKTHDQKDILGKLRSYPEHNITTDDYWLHITPNEYTHVGITPNYADMINKIDGYGANFSNTCKIRFPKE